MPGFSLDPATHSETEFLAKFKGRITDIIGCTSRPLDASGQEIGVDNPQIIVKYHPLDSSEAGEQIGFYSMGSRKEFSFDIAAKMTVGTVRAKSYDGGYVIKGPELNKKSRASRWLQSAAACGFAVTGNDLRIFTGTEWDIERTEVPQQKGLTQEKDILLLVKYYGKVGEAAPAEDVEARLIAAALDKKYPDAFIPVAYSVAIGNKELLARVLDGRWVQEQIAKGVLVKDKDGILRKPVV